MSTPLRQLSAPAATSEPARIVRGHGRPSLIVTGLGPYDHAEAVEIVAARARAFDPPLAFTALPGTGYAPPWGAEDVLTILVVNTAERIAFLARRLAAAFEQDAILVQDLAP